MPRASSVCSQPGCPHVTSRAGRCETCERAADHRRGSARDRGYDRRHERQFRALVLARDPVCVLCLVEPATVADHWPIGRRELVAAGLDPNDPQHGRGLCTSCHGRETAQHQPGGFHAER